MRCACRRWQCSWLQFPQKPNQALYVALVLINSEPDPEHVAAQIGNHVPRLELGIPTLCAGTAERKEARMRLSVERVEKLRAAQRCAADCVNELALQSLDMRRDIRGREPVIREHPAHRSEAIQRRRIEGRAEKTAGVLGVAYAARRERQILEFGEPAGDRRARGE